MAYDGSVKFDTKIDSAGFQRDLGKMKSAAKTAFTAIGAAATGAVVAVSYTHLDVYKRQPYTKEMLEDMRNKTVTYNGQEIPMYDALQKQRGLERHVKTTKRQLVGLDEALKNTPVKDSLTLKTEFQAGAVKLKRQEARIADFCKQTGLKRDRFREQVFSAETENGIKSWTKSVSQKAVAANRNALTSAAKKNIINIMPDADNIVISPAKFTGYALNPDKDANKAKAFKDALGYTVGTADKLIDNIKSNIKKFDAVEDVYKRQALLCAWQIELVADR